MEQANLQSQGLLNQQVNMLGVDQHSAGSADHLIEEDMHQMAPLEFDQRSGTGTKRKAPRGNVDLLAGSEQHSSGRWTKQK